jgi:hypothetical protein
MYPNFDNKQDRSSKHQDLLARIARDQRLEAMKREAYANAIWATDSEESKTKDATETGDTLARVVAAMRAAASTSNKKTPPGGFSSVGDIYDAMGDASNGAFSPNVNNSEDNNAPSSAADAPTDESPLSAPMLEEPMLEEPMLEAPMVEEPMLEEPMLEEKKGYNPDDSVKYRKEIVDLLRKRPFLSGYEFKPVIVRDGNVMEHNYFIKHSDGHIINNKGNRIKGNNSLLQNVDWALTFDAIQDKVSSLNRGSLIVQGVASDVRRKRLFDLWKEYTGKSLNARVEDRLGADDDLESKSVDDYKRFDMDSATPQETLKFFNWLQSRGFTPSEVDDTPPGLSVSDLDTRNPAIKRGLDDTTVSLDTRSAKKSIELTNLTERAKVQYLFDNIDGLNTMKIQPYITNKKGEVVRSEKAYLGPELKVFMIASDVSYKNQKQANKQINWPRTLSLVIDIVANYIRGYSRVIKAEKDPEKKIELQNEIEDILDMLKIADPEQGKAAEILQKLPPSSYDTPAAKPKQAPTISAEKKDFVYEGKGLIGRGLKGAGRPYNLADIEGSGRASDLKYKRIGTKFIRKADLNNNRLKLVFPSRNSVGPLRSMSNELTEMVKDLLYNDNISQQSYRSLSVEDQRVFYEIVQKTHVNHTLQTPMIDPQIELKAEFDKLRGEIALGNDNPDMLRELYRLATDMFEQKMITNKEFKSIMSALI